MDTSTAETKKPRKSKALASPDSAPKPMEKEKKVQRADLYLGITLAINRSPLISLPVFPNRYVLVKDVLGDKEILKILPDNTAVSLPSNEDVAASILKYTNKELAGHQGFRFTVNQARECADYWAMETHVVEKPPIILWKNEPGLCFHRLPWDYHESLLAQCPTWDELLGRMVLNREAFCHYIASIFYDDAYSQMYLWLDGKGGDGKSSILSFLSRVFRQFYIPGIPPSSNQESDRYLWHIMRARILAFDDLKGNALSMPTHGWFMSLTGGVPQLIKPHFKPAVRATLNIRPICTANGQPRISSEPSEMRRLVYVQLEKRNKPIYDHRYNDRLWAEGGAFLARCLRDYNLKHPDHGIISLEAGSLNDVIDSAEEDFEALFRSRFNLVEKAIIPTTRMTNIIDDKLRTHGDKTKFYKFLENKYGIVKKNKKLNDELRTMYPYLKSKDGVSAFHGLSLRVDNFA